MNIFQFLFVELFLLYSSRDIITDLPYNIYQLDDANKYETNYIPEGKKFYIRFPLNSNKDATFYLTIPKTTTLFPIYSSDFSKYPNDDEIIKAEYQNEIQLKNREDEEYSIYSFDIKKTDSYKILYFQNNEMLNYLSFYAAPINSLSAPIIVKDLEYDKKTTVRDLQGLNSYIFRVNIEEDSKIIIEIKVSTSYNPFFQVDVAYFDKFPNDEIVKNQDNFELNIDYDFKIEEGYEIRTYKTKNENEYKYFAFQIFNDNDLKSIDIIVKPDNFTFWVIIVSVVGGVIIIALIVCCLTKKGKECRECFCDKCC